jgi:hypothetical protein
MAIGTESNVHAAISINIVISIFVFLRYFQLSLSLIFVGTLMELLTLPVVSISLNIPFELLTLQFIFELLKLSLPA